MEIGYDDYVVFHEIKETSFSVHGLRNIVKHKERLFARMPGTHKA